MGNKFDRHPPIEDEGLLCFQHVEHVADGLALALQRNGGTLPRRRRVRCRGNVWRQFLADPGSAGVLAHVEAIDAAGGIVVVGHGEFRGTRTGCTQRRKRLRSTPEHLPSPARSHRRWRLSRRDARSESACRPGNYPTQQGVHMRITSSPSRRRSGCQKLFISITTSGRMGWSPWGRRLRQTAGRALYARC